MYSVSYLFEQLGWVDLLWLLQPHSSWFFLGYAYVLGNLKNRPSILTEHLRSKSNKFYPPSCSEQMTHPVFICVWWPLRRFILQYQSTPQCHRSTTDNAFFAQFSIPIATSISAFINACIIELSGVFFQVSCYWQITTVWLWWLSTLVGLI